MFVRHCLMAMASACNEERRRGGAHGGEARQRYHGGENIGAREIIMAKSIETAKKKHSKNEKGRKNKKNSGIMHERIVISKAKIKRQQTAAKYHAQSALKAAAGVASKQSRHRRWRKKWHENSGGWHRSAKLAKISA